MDSSGSVEGPEAGSCEENNQFLPSGRCAVFLGQVRDCRHRKTYSGSRSYLCYYNLITMF